MGSHIIRFLRSKNITNVVIVLTRDGDAHMGSIRYADALDCVKDVLEI